MLCEVQPKMVQVTLPAEENNFNSQLIVIWDIYKIDKITRFSGHFSLLNITPKLLEFSETIVA